VREAVARSIAMPLWTRPLFLRSHTPEPVLDPDAERAVADRLLPNAREVLLLPGRSGAAEALALVERLSPRGRVEVLCGPDAGAGMIGRLLERGFVVYDAAANLDHSLLILDRRLGWKLPTWEQVERAMMVAHRLLWTRIGQFSVQSGTVDAIHVQNRLFSLREQPFWINTAYRDLPFPNAGDEVRVIGLFSSLGGRLPMLHALRIDPQDAPLPAD
jgi:hypothetical protein